MRKNEEPFALDGVGHLDSDVGGLKDMVTEPGFATAVGLAMYGFEEPEAWDLNEGKLRPETQPVLARITGLMRRGFGVFF